MPVSVTNFLRSGWLPRDGSNASFTQRALSAATSFLPAVGSNAPGGLRTFIATSFRLEPELLDHRAPAIDLAADEDAELFGRRADEVDRGHALAERQRQNAPHLGIEFGNDRLRRSRGREHSVPFGHQHIE